MAFKELENLTLPSDALIIDCLRKINTNFHEIIFLKNKDEKIVGSVADGDIRRAILSQYDLKSPASEIMNRNFKYVDSHADRAYVLDLMRSLKIRQVPILNNHGKMIGIHFLENIISPENRANIAVVMAGGLGTRMRPITEKIPKPMALVAGRPILERIILHLVGNGIKKIFISINYLGNIIEDYFGDGSNLGCEINYLREGKVALGTGGALSLLQVSINEPFLVINGDQISRFDISDLFNFHAKTNSLATIVGGKYEYQIPFGVLNLEGYNILSIDEKPSYEWIINRGAYIFNPEVIDMVPKNIDFPITNLIDQILKRGQKVSLYETEVDWLDIGRIEDLRRVNGMIN